MEDQSLSLFKTMLKNNGHSLTKSREQIFRLLKGEQPQSMNELLKRGRRRFDRASLYRTISLFEQLGIAQRVYFGWKYKLELSDLFTSHHHHLTCLSCGRILTLKEDKRTEALINSLALTQGFQPAAHQLEIQGLCRSCQLLAVKDQS